MLLFFNSLYFFLSVGILLRSQLQDFGEDLKCHKRGLFGSDNDFDEELLDELKVSFFLGHFGLGLSDGLNLFFVLFLAKIWESITRP